MNYCNLLKFLLCSISFITLVFLFFFPTIDINFSQLFFKAEYFVGYPFRYTRYFLNVITFTIWLYLLISVFVSKKDNILKKTITIFSVLILSPVLVTNLIFKDISGRPRPIHITNFGKTEEFKPYYNFSGTCDTNCSFNSGEMSFSASLIPLTSLVSSSFTFLFSITTFALSVGLLRIASGAHFLSDICFSLLSSIVIGETIKLLITTLKIKKSREEL